MTKVLRHPARIGLLLALLVGLIGSRGNGGCHQAAMEVWADLQAQLDSHEERLVAQQDQICELYLLTGNERPPECGPPDKCSDFPDAPGCGGDEPPPPPPPCEGGDCR